MFSLLNLQSLLGLVVIVAVCWAISENRKAFPWRLTIGAILVQAGLVLDSFEEVPYAAWCPWPDLMVREGDRYRLREDPDRLALQYVLTAHRPA